MGQSITTSPIRALEGETLTLATTIKGVTVPVNFHEVKLYCDSQWRLGLAPMLRKNFVYVGTVYTDYTNYLTDKLTTTHMPLDAMATSSYCYFATLEEVRGFYFVIDSTNKNANAATLDWEYYSATGWTDVAGDSDGTTSGGATLATSGIYTFTKPTSTMLSVNSVGDYYWYRFAPSATLSATIDITEIIPVYSSSSLAYMEGGIEYQFSINRDKVGGLNISATTGTPVLDISWIKH